MTQTDFLQKFSAQFDETAPDSILIDTKFRDISEWSSLYALSIIAMIDEEYNVKISGDDIRKSQTVEDIYNLVNSRI